MSLNWWFAVAERVAFLLVSTDDHWVASPIPGQSAKTNKVIPDFEF